MAVEYANDIESLAHLAQEHLRHLDVRVMSGLLVVVERVEVDSTGVVLENERFGGRVGDSEENAVGALDLADSLESELADTLNSRAYDDKASRANAKWWRSTGAV